VCINSVIKKKKNLYIFAAGIKKIEKITVEQGKKGKDANKSSFIYSRLCDGHNFLKMWRDFFRSHPLTIQKLFLRIKL